MTITLFKDKQSETRKIGRVKSFLVHSYGDLLITFDDWSETTIKKEEYDYLDAQED